MKISPQVITAENFAPFGDLIATEGATAHMINDGTCKRFHDLARLEFNGTGAKPLVNIFRGEKRDFPLAINMMERHPLGTQTFIPLEQQEFLVVVAEAGDTPGPEDLKAFHVPGSQGVNYAPGTWHYPLIVPQGGDFLVIDRGGEGGNCDEITLAPPHPALIFP